MSSASMGLSDENTKPRPAARNSPPNTPQGNIDFTDSQIDQFLRLGAILKGIHIRLLNEGYLITDGEICAPEFGKAMIDSSN